MTIQEQIKKDLMQAMKAKDEEKKAALRVIMGEFGRGEKKDLADDEAAYGARRLGHEEETLLPAAGAVAVKQFVPVIDLLDAARFGVDGDHFVEVRGLDRADDHLRRRGSLAGLGGSFDLARRFRRGHLEFRCKTGIYVLGYHVMRRRA